METSNAMAKLQRAVNTAGRRLPQRKTKSAWDRGVNEYAAEMLHSLRKVTPQDLNQVNGMRADDAIEHLLLNGARDWHEFSEGGCSLISNIAICGRLCSPSEYKRRRYGDTRPNRQETWIDVQARALAQAARWVVVAVSVALYLEVTPDER